MPEDARGLAIQRMLFEQSTTYRNDYHSLTITEPIFTKYQKKPTCVRIRPPPLKDVHTLSNWKTTAIPFDLLHGRRDIVRTDPRTVQKPYVEESDNIRAEVQKTRPRLVMTPALSMDDIEDKTARDILITDMYTSDMTRSNKEAVGGSVCFSVKSPLPDLPAPANPISLPKLQAPYVSPEWRMDTISWDRRQLRCHCDTTAEFWLRRDLSHCNACKESAIVRRQRNMEPAAATMQR